MNPMFSFTLTFTGMSNMNGAGVGHNSPIPTVGWSNFALKNSVRGTGQSYSILSPALVVNLVRELWSQRTPGDGEGARLDRKVLVPVSCGGTPLFFCPPRVKLVVGMPVQAQVAVRPGQENTGEKPHVETWINAKDAENYDLIETPAKLVNVVCYSAAALLENGGERSTDCDWEIVTILATSGEIEPMHPLTMARNFLGLAGGTSSTYTAEEFATAIAFHANTGLKVRG